MSNFIKKYDNNQMVFLYILKVIYYYVFDI